MPVHVLQNRRISHGRKHCRLLHLQRETQLRGRNVRAIPALDSHVGECRLDRVLRMRVARRRCQQHCKDKHARIVPAEGQASKRAVCANE